MKEVIPKTIHYCWFGGNPLPELAQRCIASWKKYCPDYEIKEWNESNFDLNCCDYVREAYEAKKWAFVSDVARLYAIVTEGGIYMDTDVEVVQPLDSLLQYEAVSGFESKSQIQTGLMACREGQELFKELLHDYDNIHFLKEDGTFDTTTNVVRITKVCVKYGLRLDNTKQTVNGFTLLPQDYLCPKSYETGELEISDNTLAIHHFNGSWMPKEEIYRRKISQKLYAAFPMGSGRFAPLFCGFIAAGKYHGTLTALRKVGGWITKKQKVTGE